DRIGALLAAGPAVGPPGRAALPANGSHEMEALLAGRVAQAGILNLARCADHRDARRATVAQLGAGHAHVGAEVGRAVGGTDAAPDGMVVGPADRIAQSAVHLLVAVA